MRYFEIHRDGLFMFHAFNIILIFNYVFNYPSIQVAAFLEGEFFSMTTKTNSLKPLQESVSNSIVYSNSYIVPRHPIILLLDKHTQCLPWESIPLLKEYPGNIPYHFLYLYPISAFYHTYLSLHLLYLCISIADAFSFVYSCSNASFDPRR